MKKSILKRALTLTLAVTALVGLTACKNEEYKYDNPNANVSLSKDINYVDYTESAYEERAKVLGLLEKYAVENNLTGLTIFGDGGFQMYHPRVIKGTDTYIPGYGFGTLSEGRITADLEAESNAAWKRYYHSFQTDDPKTINYMNDKGSVVSALVGYVHGSLWTTAMNASRDGYEWINDLAKTKPVALNANENGYASKYRWEIKVGEELQYNTLTNDSALKAYAGRNVALEDYLVPFKELHNQANGMARGAEKLTGTGSIKGMNDYYQATKDGYNQEAWDKVGLKTYSENGKNYMEVEFNSAYNSFYAMYYMASSLYAPIPADFVTAIGGIKNYGSYDGADRGPVDTTLSTSVYVLEHWEEDMQIVFKRNSKYEPNSAKYQIEGLHFNILSAQKTDAEAAFKEFQAGKLDAVGIPSTKLTEFKSDPRTTTVAAGSNYKLNLNTCDQEMWEKLFGTNGSVTQTAKSEYWDVKPIMSNADFIKGLSFALNRKELADQVGRTAALDFFADVYLSDPENGISYNSTQYHKNAIASITPDGTDEYGYSLELAKYYFKKAADALISQGKYKAGDTVEIEIAWQTDANIKTYAAIANYFETAFNASGAQLTLKVTQMAPAVWSDVYYAKMMVGQFDIGFGSISGNTLNPLDFFDTLKSDNSSGFTLNWSVDTSKVDPSLIYNNQAWSFDALWAVFNGGALVANGEEAKIYDAVLKSSVLNSDKTRTVVIVHDTIDTADFSATLKDIVVRWYDGDEEKEEKLTYTVSGKNITIVMSQELLDKITGPISIDVIYDVSTEGGTSEGVVTINSQVKK